MAGRPRRSASDALKGATVPKDATEADATAPAGDEAVKAADAPAGGTAPDTQDAPDTTSVQDAPDAPDTQDSTPPADDADVEDEDDAEDDLVEARVTTDAFNYFQDGTHQTARKGEVIVLERHVAERGLSLNALASTDQD